MLGDWRTAPAEEGLHATLAFLQKATLQPGKLGPADIDVVREAGVSDEAIEDALAVCAYFNLIDRLADSYALTPISELIGTDALVEYGAKFLERGYV